MKILYKNTFDNTITQKYDSNFPREDQFFANKKVAVVADGITRDPIGISWTETKENLKKAIEHYPRPSGAELAAKEVASTFEHNFTGNLKETMILANNNIKLLNEKYVPVCDYLENDYYGTVAAATFIENHILYYAYICDCGIIVYDKNGKIIFQTEDEYEKISRPFFKKLPYLWEDDRARVIRRRDYRNNLNMICDGKCVSYGALTGEDSAKFFIREGMLPLKNDNVVVVYSDGFFNYLHDPQFIEQILNFDKMNFEKYVQQKATENYGLYGKERTLILLKEED